MRREDGTKWVVAGILLLVLVGATVLLMSMTNRKVMVTVGDAVVFVRVAITPGEHQKGLSGTKKLADNEGMLFVADRPKQWSIWMKDMHYSLDIVWLDKDKRIIDIAEDISPDTYPETFTPSTEASYVLELKSGFVNRHNVVIGSRVDFSVQ